MCHRKGMRKKIADVKYNSSSYKEDENKFTDDFFKRVVLRNQKNRHRNFRKMSYFMRLNFVLCRELDLKRKPIRLMNIHLNLRHM